MTEPLEFTLGQMSSAIKTMNENLTIVCSDVKILLSDSAGNKERFANGIRHFEKNDLLITDHERRISIVEDKRFPWGKVGGLITVGFIVLAFFVALYK